MEGNITSASSVPEFCRAHRISPSFFYKLQREKRGPRLMRIGGRTLVSAEAAADWRRAIECAGDAK